MLVGRGEASERVAWAIANARSGAGAAVVVTGEPGSGKSTLLDSAVRRAGDAVVLRATGVPVEKGLPHSALHALLWPILDRLDALPEVQRQALAVALGQEHGPPPSPFLLGAATLTLLAAAADTKPVVVVLDDAQWVDAASLEALAFAARRLAGERVGVVVAARAAEVPAALAGLDGCALGDVTTTEAAQILSPQGVMPDVAAELVARAGGNVLALVELSRRLDDAQRAGRAPLPSMPQTGPVFEAQARELPSMARDAAALAALADEVAAPVLAVARSELGLAAGDLRAAEDAGLLTAAAAGVRWRHPLARAAVLEVTPPSRRRELARALADAAEQTGAAESVVVEFRLGAADGPDETLALAFERVANDAGSTGDHQRASAMWVHAAETGTDPARRSTRVLESAESLLRGGLLSEARPRYEAALDAGLDAEGQARALLALGRIEHVSGSPRRAVDRFKEAAAVAPTPAARVRACAEGVLATMYAGLPGVARELADEAVASHDPNSAVDRMLVGHAQGVAESLAGNRDAARPLLLGVIDEGEASGVLGEEPDLVWLVVTAPLFVQADPDAGADIATPALDQLRLRGDMFWLPRVLRLWGVRHLVAGRMQAAYATIEEAAELSRDAGQTTQLVDALGVLAELEALRGDREACLAHVAELESLLPTLGVPFLAGNAWAARGLLHLGLGEAALAAEQLAHSLNIGEGVLWRAAAVADLVEALILDGRRDEAETAAAVADSPRAAALVLSDDAEAVSMLLAAAAATSEVIERARCRLLAGERLRRAGLRREAREHLQAASDSFAAAGAAPWRRRAEAELQASGAVLSRAYEDETLTGAELRVAALVAEGRPTREVAALLFLSPKTVEFHLGRIYRKLGVRGRAELAHRLAGESSTSAAGARPR
ncbi:MAG TPA: AAA family ATPase [Mycobacteriales bacterium]|nr:AAA family ATPase [Mycobacteriales bacterium]